MPSPKITPDIKLNQLKNYVQDVAKSTKEKAEVLYSKTNDINDDSQRKLLQSVINSARGEKKEARALSVLYEALSNTYSEDVAAKVFSQGEVSGALFGGEATLSTDLIDKVERAAEEEASKREEMPSTDQVGKIVNGEEPAPSEPLESSHEDEIKPDVPSQFDKKDDEQSSSINQQSRSNVNSKTQTEDNSELQPTKKARGGLFGWFRSSKKPSTLADIQNNTENIKQTYKKLGDDFKDIAKKQKKRKAELRTRNWSSRRKFLTLKKRRAANSAAARQKEIRSNLGMQAEHYINVMGKGGNKKGVMDSNRLIAKAAAALDPKPDLSRFNGSTDLKKVIRDAFVNVGDTGKLAMMTDKQRTEDVIIPALTEFLKKLPTQKS